MTECRDALTIGHNSDIAVDLCFGPEDRFGYSYVASLTSVDECYSFGEVVVVVRQKGHVD